MRNKLQSFLIHIGIRSGGGSAQLPFVLTPDALLLSIASNTLDWVIDVSRMSRTSFGFFPPSFLHFLAPSMKRQRGASLYYSTNLDLFFSFYFFFYSSETICLIELASNIPNNIVGSAHGIDLADSVAGLLALRSAKKWPTPASQERTPLPSSKGREFSPWKWNYVHLTFDNVQERCTRTIAMAYIGSILLCIPSFITFGIEQNKMPTPNDGLNRTLSTTPETAAAGIVIYKVDLNPIAKKHDDFIHKVTTKNVYLKRNRFHV